MTLSIAIKKWHTQYNIILCVVTLSIFALNVVELSIFVLCVVKLSVVRLSVLAPKKTFHNLNHSRKLN